MTIYELTYSQLEAYLKELGENPAKASFIYKGLYQQPIRAFGELTMLKATLLERLAADFDLALPELKERSDGEKVSKFLFALADDCLIEAVLMRQHFGNSVCISTQVGCNMACAFCQSGRFKKVRNLTAGEMTAQVLAVQQALGEAISNVVLMGIGEPFDNYEAVMAFLEIITHPKGLAIGPRHITVSTCGLTPRIYDYLAHPCHGQLAVSLHAAEDDLRSQLMPVNRRYPLEELMKAVRTFSQVSGKKVMLEYILLEGLNDQPEQAKALAALVQGTRLHVNLIPYNGTQNLGFAASSPERIRAFYDVLKKEQVLVTMRREFGGTIDGACGQLRAAYEGTPQQKERMR